MDQCKYCNGTERIVRRHLRSCPFKPSNNKKIMSYLESLVLNNKPFKINEYNKFAVENNLPVSNTILALFKRNNFISNDSDKYYAFIYLIYRSYELNLLTDLELLDLLVYKITFGMFGLSCKDYLTRAHLIVDKAGSLSHNVIHQRYVELGCVCTGLDVSDNL